MVVIVNIPEITKHIEVQATGDSELGLNLSNVRQYDHQKSSDPTTSQLDADDQPNHQLPIISLELDQPIQRAPFLPSYCQSRNGQRLTNWDL